jgi:hypothetical protein
MAEQSKDITRRLIYQAAQCKLETALNGKGQGMTRVDHKSSIAAFAIARMETLIEHKQISGLTPWDQA